MPWAKFDDGFHEHPKIASMSDKAFRLYVCSITYSRRHKLKGILSDGHRLVLFRLTGCCQEQDDELVNLHGWDIRDDGSRQVHDIGFWNPEYDEELLQKRAEAGRRGGIQSGITRSNEAKVKQVASTNEANPKLRESDSDSESYIQLPPDGPSEEAVTRFFKSHGRPELASDYFNARNSVGWHTNAGLSITDWPSDAKRWIARQNGRIAEGNGHRPDLDVTEFTIRDDRDAVKRRRPVE